MTKRPLPTHRPTRSSRKPLRLLATGVASLLLVAGCASGADAPGAVQAGGNAAAAEVVSPEAAGFLAKLGMSGRSATEVIDALDAQTGERQKDVLASVRYDTLVLKDASGESKMKLPDGQFYLSIAPYVNQTHECFYHSLTTCSGELAGQTVDVTIVDSAGKTLVQGPVKTYSNGFVGFWLPRDIQGTITVAYEGRTATSAITTDREAPTCLSTLQLT